MALENEEIQRMMEDAASKVQGLGTAAGTSAEQQKKAAQAQAEFTANLQKSVRGLSQMGSSLQQGGSQFKVLGDTIQGMTGIISGVSKSFGMFGKAFAGIADGVGAAAKFVTDQLDQMSKNYGALGEAGATAADGITGMQRQFEQMGNMSLPAFTKAVNENALGMAAFGGTVAEGAEKFSSLAGDLTRGDIGQRFLKLGMTFDQVGESAAKYASNTARYGGLQNTTQQQLIASSQKYLEEMDLLSRMTGTTRKEQEQEQLKSLSDVRFRAKLMEMEANGQHAAAEEMRKTAAGLKGPLADAFRASVTGVTLTDDAAEANLLTGDTIRQAGVNIQNGSTSIAEVGKIMKGANEGAKTFGANMMLAGDTFGGSAIQVMDMAAIQRKAEARAAKDGISLEEAVQIEQSKLLTATDKNTEAFIASQQAAANASKNMQLLSTTVALSATPAIKDFADGLEVATDWINKNFGSGNKTSANEKGWYEKAKDAIKTMIPGLGKIAAQFESGGNASAVSTGIGDKGGKSYGAFQLSSATGDLDKFLKVSGFDKAFEGLTRGSAEFDKKWKELAKTDKSFGEAQGKYAQQKYYDPQMEKLKGLGIDLSGKGQGVQEAILSTANQYGAQTDTIVKALKGKDAQQMSDKDIINAIQDYKAQNIQSNFRSSSADVQAGVSRRVEQERSMLLGLSGPADTYKSSINSNDPNKLSQSQATQTAPALAEQQTSVMTTLLQQLNDKMDNLARISSDQLSVQQKTYRQGT